MPRLRAPFSLPVSLPVPVLLAPLGLLVLVAAGAAQTVFVQPPESVPAQEEFTLAVVLDTAGVEVLGLEISLSFDPLLVRLEGIDPGAWFTDGGAEWFFWDYTHTGTELIHFTGSRLGSASSTGGQVAVCRFTAQEAGISPLDFLGVEVRDFLNQDVHAGHSYGDRIVIDQAVAVVPDSFGGIKSLYR